LSPATTLTDPWPTRCPSDADADAGTDAHADAAADAEPDPKAVDQSDPVPDNFAHEHAIGRPDEEPDVCPFAGSNAAGIPSGRKGTAL
jgi:hypothetical protein